MTNAARKPSHTFRNCKKDRTTTGNRKARGKQTGKEDKGEEQRAIVVNQKWKKVKIVYGPDDDQDDGRPIAATGELRKHIVPQLDALCMRYRFGEVLRQEYACDYFHLCFLHVHMNKGGYIYLKWHSPAKLLQYLLKPPPSEDGFPPTPLPSCYLRITEGAPFPLVLAGGFSGHMFLGLGGDLQRSLREGLRETTAVAETGPNEYHSIAVPVNYRVAEILSQLRNQGTRYEDLSSSLLPATRRLVHEFNEEYRITARLKRSADISYKETFIRIRNEILYSPNIQHHTITALSRKYGISRDILWRGFYKLFGTSISAFTREALMGKARLLLTTTPIPMKIISADLGYRHEKNFCRAFRQYFYILPHQMRLRSSYRED